MRTKLLEEKLERQIKALRKLSRKRKVLHYRFSYGGRLYCTRKKLKNNTAVIKMVTCKRCLFRLNNSLKPPSFIVQGVKIY